MDCVGPSDGLTGRVQGHGSNRVRAHRLRARPILAVAAAAATAGVLAADIGDLVVAYQRVHLRLIVVQFLSYMHRLHRLTVIFEVQAAKWRLPLLVRQLLMGRLLAVLEEFGLTVEVEGRLLLRGHRMSLHGLVRQVIATWLLLTFLPKAIVAGGVRPPILLWRHLIEII